ncbi:hypothetical protein OUZ56_003061 [Daphnia magna]|uniref:Uncharacterized protein n=1 Tax=Daphnia magna TaxID=35525 RepID=A0ABR0A7X5_9CRUS|nr:hypothetical protein OUZ56_003061 [Daphnia magna]
MGPMGYTIRVVAAAAASRGGFSTCPKELPDDSRHLSAWEGGRQASNLSIYLLFPHLTKRCFQSGKTYREDVVKKKEDNEKGPGFEEEEEEEKSVLFLFEEQTGSLSVGGGGGGGTGGGGCRDGHTSFLPRRWVQPLLHQKPSGVRKKKKEKEIEF